MRSCESKPAFFATPAMRAALDKKPPHGAPCNHCGMCCMATLCQLGQTVFKLPEYAGMPCPALEQVEDADCACGHSWNEHARTANGAFACKHFGCGCRDVVQPKGYRCGIVTAPEKYASRSRLMRFGVERLRRAAILIIGAGDGCDARFNGERRDEAFAAALDCKDAARAHERRKAKRIWGARE